jgi:GntR family transcriptional regulator of arabinose operon
MTKKNFTINLGITGNKVEKEAILLRKMLDNNVDGLIIEGTKSALPNPNLDILSEFKLKHIPVVFINGNYSDYDSPYVMMDDIYSGKIATDYLIRNGHRSIGGIFKSDDIQGHRRYAGYAAALRENGLLVPEESILWYTTEDLAEIFSESYSPIFTKRFKKCSAILCYNDQIAVKAIEMAERIGLRVPKNISIVGFDNSDLCEVNSVRLSSVSHARAQMGKTAAKILIQLMADTQIKPSEQKILFKPELIKRDSVKKII